MSLTTPAAGGEFLQVRVRVRVRFRAMVRLELPTCRRWTKRHYHTGAGGAAGVMDYTRQ